MVKRQDEPFCADIGLIEKLPRRQRIPAGGVTGGQDFRCRRYDDT